MPGQWQTILRAELTAVIMAAQYSIQADQPARIWCDNATMVRRMLYMQAGRFFQQNTLADHDLRGPLHEFFVEICTKPISIIQFSKSHRIRQRFFYHGCFRATKLRIFMLHCLCLSCPFMCSRHSCKRPVISVARAGFNRSFWLSTPK